MTRWPLHNLLSSLGASLRIPITVLLFLYIVIISNRKTAQDRYGLPVLGLCFSSSFKPENKVIRVPTKSKTCAKLSIASAWLVLYL